MGKPSEEYVLELASDLAGKWTKFGSFVLDSSVREHMTPESDWAIVYFRSRDSTLMEESNADAIEKRMKPFLGWIGDGSDCDTARHSHWAVGWVEGFYLRVFRDGKPTEAFREWAAIRSELDDYPILDDEDHSTRVYEATLDNLKEVVRIVCNKHDVEGEVDEGDVFSWLDENDPNQLDDVDDRGGYPSEDSVLAALRALGFVKEEPEEEEDEQEEVLSHQGHLHHPLRFEDGRPGRHRKDKLVPSDGRAFSLRLGRQLQC